MPKKKKSSLIFTDVVQARKFYLHRKVSFRDAAGTHLIGYVKDVRREGSKVLLVVRDVPGRMTATYHLPAHRQEVFVVGRDQYVKEQKRV